MGTTTTGIWIYPSGMLNLTLLPSCWRGKDVRLNACLPTCLSMAVRVYLLGRWGTRLVQYDLAAAHRQRYQQQHKTAATSKL